MQFTILALAAASLVIATPMVSPFAASATGVVVLLPVSSSTSGLTEEEDRELAELMDELGD